MPQARSAARAHLCYCTVAPQRACRAGGQHGEAPVLAVKMHLHQCGWWSERDGGVPAAAEGSLPGKMQAARRRARERRRAGRLAGRQAYQHTAASLGLSAIALCQVIVPQAWLASCSEAEADGQEGTQAGGQLSKGDSRSGY